MFIPGFDISSIPLLDPSLQAHPGPLPSPLVRWGSISRRSRMPGTYHFYTADYRFSALTKRPDALPATGCLAAVEPNYSTAPDTPIDIVLELTRRKRTLARLWQSSGVRIVADLNVDPAFRDVNFLGIPRGWRSYAVRSQAGIAMETIEADHAAATAHAGTSDILFLVVGGHMRMRSECLDRGWTWSPEESDAARGRRPSAKEQWHGKGPGGLG